MQIPYMGAWVHTHLESAHGFCGQYIPGKSCARLMFVGGIMVLLC